MTARDRDPQGVSDPAADLTRIEALREACAQVAESETACLVTSGGCGWEPGKEIAAAIRALDLARLAPATPQAAATAEHPRDDADTREERTP